jgi:NADPH2:quinone reductase
MAFPRVIPHQDGAGVIQKVGSNISESRIGERVWLYEAQWQRPHGTAAEFTTVRSRQAVTLPDNVSFHEGACLGIPAMTAHRCVFADEAVNGQRILVAGGAGAVGFYAIQFAKLGGAFVITTVSSARDADTAVRAGADIVIDRKKEDVAKRVLEITENKGVDRIIEVAFGENAYLDAAIIAENGKIAAYASDAEHDPRLPFYGFMMKNTVLHFVLVYRMSEQAHQAAADEIGKCLRTNSLKHLLPAEFGLNDIVLAHTALESGTIRGKVVVTI